MHGAFLIFFAEDIFFTSFHNICDTPEVVKAQSSSSSPERVQISLIPIEIIAKLPPAALFSQNMCSWFYLYSMLHLLQYYDLFA